MSSWSDLDHYHQQLDPLHEAGHSPARMNPAVTVDESVLQSIVLRFSAHQQN